MRRTVWVAALAALVAACGGGEPEALPGNEPAANRPPELRAVVINPAAPLTSDELTVAVRVEDPDRDTLSIEVEWFRNGVSAGRGRDERMPPFRFKRGDRVHAVVFASDGTETVSVASDEVEVRNAPARVTSVQLEPETALATDEIRAAVQAADVDEDPLEYRFRWRANGAPLPIEGASLPPGTVRRDDQVQVEVAAFDGIDLGPWSRSVTVRIGNAAPAITTEPSYTLVGDGTYQYKVAAEDPDGDAPLRYELLEGPDGMRVDPASGVVTWQVPTDANGSFPIELSVSDPHGGRTLQRYSLDLAWEENPASPAP